MKITPDPTIKFDWDVGMNDVIGERKDDVRKVREFLYVDHERIRSYYSQINRGVIEEVVTRGTGHIAGEIGVRLFGFGPSASAGRDREREESRSLQDLNYVIFEELFEGEGLIRDVTDEADGISAWESGQIYSSINEGDIIRYTGDIQVLDPEFVKNRVSQFGNMASAIAGAQIGPQEAESSTPPARKGGATRSGQRGRTAEQVRQAMKDEQIKKMTGGVSLGLLADIVEFVSAFTSDSITVRALPFGTERPEYHFAGTLLSRSEYIQPEREALFSRYGMNLDDWTVVMQVARISSSAPAPVSDFGQPTVTGDVLSRGSVEKMLTNLMAQMEALGMAEGAQYPAISVTVLAIYREFA